jgi:hypothetical protein
MDELFSDIKDKSIYKKILENLKEVAKKYLYVQNGQSVEQNIRDFNYHVEQLYKNITDIQVEGSTLMKETEDKLRENLVQLYYTVKASDYDPP